MAGALCVEKQSSESAVKISCTGSHGITTHCAGVEPSRFASEESTVDGTIGGAWVACGGGGAGVSLCSAADAGLRRPSSGGGVEAGATFGLIPPLMLPLRRASRCDGRPGAAAGSGVAVADDDVPSSGLRVALPATAATNDDASRAKRRRRKVDVFQ